VHPKSEEEVIRFCFIFINVHIFLKGHRNILGFYMLVFKEIILKIRKYIANLKKRLRKVLTDPSGQDIVSPLC